MTTPTLHDIIASTAERGMPDLLIAIADYFYCLGAGIIPPPPTQPGRANLLTTLEHIHRIEVLAPRGWADDPKLLHDEVPGWLLSLPQQAEPQHPTLDTYHPPS